MVSSTLVFDILARDRASDTFDKVGKKADGLSDRLGVVKSTGEVLGKAAGLIAVGVAGIGVSAATTGLKTAAGMETARIGFTTMLGSAQKADSFLKNLADFAASTPFEFPELQTAASSLVSAGVSADKVIPIMKSLGNATAGMGTGSEGIKRATVALQQMNAAGKITGEDLNQLRDAGIPVYDLLASALHKPKTEVTALAQAGKLGKNELDLMMKALESGAGLERFSGLMDKQSQSLTGLWSTLKDTFSQGMATAIGPAIPLIKDGLGAAIQFTSDRMPQLAAGIATVTKRAQELAPQVMLGFAAMKSAFDGEGITSGGLVGKFEHVGVFARDLVDKFDTLKTSVKAMTSAFNGEGVTSSGMVGFFETLGVAARQVADAFRGMDFSKFQQTFASLGPTVQSASGSLPALNAALDTTSTVFGFVSDHIDLVVKAMPYLLGAFVAVKTVQAANNIIGRESLIGFALQLAANGSLVASNFALAASMKSVAVAQGENTAASSTGLIAKVKDTAATAASTVAKFATAAATAAVTAAQWLWNVALTANPIGLVIVGIAALIAVVVLIATKTTWFQTVWEYTWGAVTTVASGAWNNVLKPTFAFLIQYVQAAWANFNTFKDTVSTVWDNIKTVTLTGVRSVVGFFFDMAGRILDAAAQAFGWVPGIGDKLRDAQGKFQVFRDSVNASLSGIHDEGIRITADMVAREMRNGSLAILDNTPHPMAAGGPVSGPGSGTSDTAGLYRLSNGEHVLTAKDVSSMGGQNAVMAFRKSLAGMAGGGPVNFGVDTRLPDPGWLGDHAATLAEGAKDRLQAGTSAYMNKVIDQYAGAGLGPLQNLGGGRVGILGKMLDATTAGIFQKVSAILPLSLMQGSWSSSVAASGGTHSGAGAMDVWNSNWRRAVDLIRANGAIAWHRTPSQGPWAEHIHSITPGVPGLSAAAASQVAQFRAGGNGLGGPDNNGYSRGGPVLFDQGGWLDPGLTLAVNKTGTRERVLAPGQGGAVENHFHYHGTVIQERDAGRWFLAQLDRRAQRGDYIPAVA